MPSLPRPAAAPAGKANKQKTMKNTQYNTIQTKQQQKTVEEEDDEEDEDEEEDDDEEEEDAGDDAEASEQDEDEENEEEEEEEAAKSEEEHSEDDGEEEANSGKSTPSAPSSSSVVLSSRSLSSFEARQSKRGVIYLSRIPPYLKPIKLRSILSDYGEVLRIYFTPEDAAIARRRKKGGGSSKQKYVDGWVEFADKRIAKRVAFTLNNQLIGGKKRNYYHDDLWNMKYLSGFKWSNLTEKVAYEKHIREQKIRIEMEQATKETAFYMKQVEQAKKVKAIEERRAAKGGLKRKLEALAAAPADKQGEGNDMARGRKFHQRTFIERKTIADSMNNKKPRTQNDKGDS